MRELICITCPRGCHLRIDEEGGLTVTGNGCARGEAYALKELTDPTRILTSTVRIRGAAIPRLPVKSRGELPKALVAAAAARLDEVQVEAPVALGQVVLADILGTGVDIVATRTLEPAPAEGKIPL